MNYSCDDNYFDDYAEGVYIDPATYEKLEQESRKKLAEIDKAFSKFRPGSVDPIRPSSCQPESDYSVNMEFRRKLSRDLAAKAVQYYNEKEGADFELFEIKDRICDLLPRYSVFHINFEAKPKYCAESRPQLFFAEAYQFHEKRDDFAVKFCVMLDPYSPNVIKGCSLCKDLLHPKGYKFLYGPDDVHLPNCGLVDNWGEEDGFDSDEYMDEATKKRMLLLPGVPASEYFQKSSKAFVAVCPENAYLCNPYIPNDPVNVEFNLKMSREMAGKALRFYKEKEDADYELVEIMGRCCDLHPCYIVFHINFEAKPKDCSQSRPQLFFAETYRLHEKRDDYAVKLCVLLDPSSPDVISGCRLCKYLLHPRGYKFLCGPEGFQLPDVRRGLAKQNS